MCDVPDVSNDGRQVLVVGDGIAGLSAAAFLQRRGLDPTVVAGTTDRSAGQGAIDGDVTLWHTGVALLHELGVASELEPSAVEVDAWLISTGEGTVLDRLETAHDEHPFLVADRRRLRWALRQHLPSNSIRETKTPRELCTDDGSPVIEFEDGVHERFDLVVGADGTDSWVRDAGFDAPEPTSWGTTTWMFGADGAEVPGTVAEAWGADVMVTIVPTATGACGRFVTTARDAVAAADVFAGAFDHTGHPVTGGLALPDPDALVGTPDHVLQVDPWVTDRLALLGDAAHSLPPCSLGPTLAIEDAYVLAEELADRETLPAALQRFEHRRRGRLLRLDRRSAAVGADHCPLSVAGLSELQELRRSILRSSFARRSAGATEDLLKRL